MGQTLSVKCLYMNGLVCLKVDIQTNILDKERSGKPSVVSDELIDKINATEKIDISLSLSTTINSEVLYATLRRAILKTTTVDY